MDEKQLRELIQLASRLGVMGTVLGMLRKRGDDTAVGDEAKPTGLRRFLPGFGRKRKPEQSSTEQPASSVTEQTSRQRANLRFDAIVSDALGEPRQQRTGGDDYQMPNSEPGGKPRAAAEPEEPVDLKDIITGAVERQDGVSRGEPTVDQPEVPGVPATAPREPQQEKEPSKLSNAMDGVQLGLDAIGVVDPTPISDGANAVISLGRAFITDPERRKEHLQNAAISAVSMVPYVGDTAKLAKVPRAARTLQRTMGGAKRAGKAARSDMAATAAQKQATRQQYREGAERVTGAEYGDQGDMEETAAQQGLPAAGGGSRIPPGGTGIPPTAGDGDDISKAREEAEGVSKFDEFSEKLRSVTEKVAGFGGALGRGAVKVYGLIESLKFLNTGVLALNRNLAPYSGQLASAYALADSADIQRDMRKSQALSGSLTGLSREQTELKDNLQAATQPIEKAVIDGLTVLTRFANNMMDFAGAVVDVVPGLRTALDKYVHTNDEPVNNTAWMEFLHDVSDGKFDGKRPTFVNPRSQILNDADQRDVFGP